MLKSRFLKHRKAYGQSEICLRKYVFLLYKVVVEPYFVNCNKEMPSFQQFFLCSILFSKLEKSCAKEGILILQCTKKLCFEHFLKSVKS